MGVSVVFEGASDAIEVVPGVEAECGLRLENTGMVVDRVLLDLLGDAAEWAQVEPAQLNLLPGATERVRIRFRPPRAASLAPGEVPFAVRAMSSEDPEGSSIEEGLVRVAEFGELGAQLAPKSATGRRSARFRLVVENRGNRPEPIRVEPFDPDAKLGFKARPGTFVAQPGTATFVRLKTVPRKTFFRGPNRTLPFAVTALPEQGQAAADEGVMLEKQVLPEWLFPVVAIAAVVCGVLFALWFTVLRPVVNSAATAADSASSAQAQANKAAGAANEAAKAANAKSGTLTALAVKVAAPTVLTGSTDLATASGTAANGANSNPKVVWTSSNPGVATVSQSGVVTAVSPGTATITATGTSPSSSASPSPSAGTDGAVQPQSDLGGPFANDTLAPDSGPAAPAVVSGSATVNVVGPVSVSTVALPQAVLGKTYSESLTGTGGTGAYTWSVSTGSLPAGFTLSPDGVLTGTPSAIGTTSFKVQLVNPGPPYQFAAKTFTLAIIDAPAVSTSSLPGATIGTLYAQTLTAVFGTAPYSWSLVPGQGVLPNGMVLNATTGVLTGTPTATGVFSFSVQVTDSAAQPQSASQQLTIAVANPLVVKTPKALPQEGVRNAPYSLTLAASGGTQPYTWFVTSGSLPLGLTLNSASGVISGVPSVSGPATFTVQVTSLGPPALKANEEVTLTVVDAPIVSTSSLSDATTGSMYSQKLTATFGTAPYTWSLVPGQGVLPDGLTITPGTNEIAGTPTTPGTFPFTVQTTDQTTPTQTATQKLSITVADPLVISTPATLPQEGVKSAPYSQPLAASGGTAPYTWSISAGHLPLGLTLNPATGAISGTPTGPDTQTFTAHLADSGLPARVTTRDFTITVVTPLAVSTSSLSDATTGSTYSQKLAATFGTGPYTWSLVPGQGVLPDGLTITPGTNEIAGTPTTPGTFAFTVQATDQTTPTQTATQKLSITVADPLSISTLELPDGVVQKSYSLNLNASGGTQPYTWSVTGNLPPGLSLDPATGVISGTPTKAVSASFSVTATDSGHLARTTAPRALTLDVVPGLTGTTSSLPQGAVGLAYSAGLTATGGTTAGSAGSYVWTLTGTLPPGLSLSASGQITGAPTQTGVFPFSVQATDVSSPPLTTTESLSIAVVGSLQITTQTLSDALVGQSYSQPLTATGGTAPYTWTVSPGTLPAGLSFDPVTGVISGTALATTPANPPSITFGVADAGPPTQKATKTLTLRVSSPLTFSVQIPVAITGQPLDITPIAHGGSNTFVWSQSGLPDGLNFNTATGEITSNAVTAKPGTYAFQLSLSDHDGGLPTQTGHFSLTVVAPLAAPGSINLNTRFGTAFHRTIQPTGGLAPYSFDSTNVPTGMSIDTSTGVISGTPDVQCSSTTDTTSNAGQTETFACVPPPIPDSQVTISDSLGETSIVTVHLTVDVPPLVVEHAANITQTPDALLNALVGTVRGGYGGGAVTFAATGLPCDFSGTGNCDQIDSTTGRVTGNLHSFVGTTVTVTVTQHDPTSGSANTYVGQYQLTINPPPSGTTPSPSASSTP